MSRRAWTTGLLAALSIASLAPTSRIAFAQEPQAAATARLLLARAEQNLAAREPGQASRQAAQAALLWPEAARDWSGAAALRDALVREAAIVQRGRQAAQALDAAGVQAALRELHALDRHSVAALTLVLQANARAADRGGAVQRLSLPTAGEQR